MRPFRIIAGLLILGLLSVYPLARDIDEYKVQLYGERVTVTIIFIQQELGSRNPQVMRFDYKGNSFVKKIDPRFKTEHKAGELLRLKHSEDTDIFLFEDQRVEKEFFGDGLFAILGLFLLITGFRKK